MESRDTGGVATEAAAKPCESAATDEPRQLAAPAGHLVREVVVGGPMLVAAMRLAMAQVPQLRDAVQGHLAMVHGLEGSATVSVPAIIVAIHRQGRVIVP